jgi:hypothetical protein
MGQTRATSSAAENRLVADCPWQLDDLDRKTRVALAALLAGEMPLKVAVNQGETSQFSDTAIDMPPTSASTPMGQRKLPTGPKRVDAQL